MTKNAHGYRISQVVYRGEGFIALIKGSEIVGRYTTWESARAAYRAATSNASK